MTTVTFPGKAGDILWSLPTVREIARMANEPVNVVVNEKYKSLCSLLTHQPYIQLAYPHPNWPIIHENMGTQPAASPDFGLSHVIDLGYRSTPDRPLAEFTAAQQGIQLPRYFIPFISPPSNVMSPRIDVTYGFGAENADAKITFLAGVRNARPLLRFIWVDIMPWDRAAAYIANSKLFLGCRSALAVLAKGLGIPVLTYEPNSARRHPIFSCNAACEYMPDPNQFETFLSIIDGYTL